MSILYEFCCPACGKFLVWTHIKGKVLCNKCDRWIKFDDLNAPRSVHINDSTEITQLSMF